MSRAVIVITKARFKTTADSPFLNFETIAPRNVQNKQIPTTSVRTLAMLALL